MRDDLTALWESGWRLLVLRAGPEDLPYSPALTWIALGLMAAIYPTWALAASEPPDGVALAGIELLIAWVLISAIGLLGTCVVALRTFNRSERFHQFALALAIVHGLAMAALLGSTLARSAFVGPEPAHEGWRMAVVLGAGWLPVVAILWYGLAMSHVWARTLDLGYGLGLLLTLLQNAMTWVAPILVLMAFTTLHNLLA